MRKERKVLFDKLLQIEQMEMAETELSCGYCSKERADALERMCDGIWEQIARTHGMTYREYSRMIWRYSTLRAEYSDLAGMNDAEVEEYLDWLNS